MKEENFFHPPVQLQHNKKKLLNFIKLIIFLIGFSICSCCVLSFERKFHFSFTPNLMSPSVTDHKKCEMNVIDYYLQKTQLKLQVSMFYVVFMLLMLRFWHFPFRVTDMCNNFKILLCKIAASSAITLCWEQCISKMLVVEEFVIKNCWK